MTNFLNIGVPLWVALLIFALGALAGFMVQVGWYEFHGRRVVLPFIARTSRNLTIMAMVLGAISLVTVVQVQVVTSQSTRCDQEFRSALKYNTDLGASTRDLDTRERMARDDGRVAIADLVRDLTVRLTTPPPPTVDDTASLLARYNYRAEDVAKRLEHLNIERDAVNAQRAPYPEPTCGQ